MPLILNHGHKWDALTHAVERLAEGDLLTWLVVGFVVLMFLCLTVSRKASSEPLVKSRRERRRARERRKSMVWKYDRDD